MIAQTERTPEDDLLAVESDSSSQKASPKKK
jgi:hypothetical protein